MDAIQENLTAWLFDPTVGKIVFAVVGILVFYTLSKLARRALTDRIKDTNTRYRTRKLVTFINYVLVILFLASVFSDKLGGFTVAFGVAGAGIAFALQEVIASVAGWLAVTFSSFYKTGDRVQLGGIKGDVIDIGVLRTTIFEIGNWVNGDLYNGRVVRVANSFVFKEPVFNYSGDFPFLWDEITIPVRHGSDRALTRQIMEKVARAVIGDYAEKAAKTWKELVKNYMIEEARVAPMITMVMDENWMTYTIRYVVDFKKRRGTKDALFEQILDEFQKTDGRVSVASAAQEITLMKPSIVEVIGNEKKSQ